MPKQPAYNPRIDELTVNLLASTDDLRAQLDAGAPGPIIRSKAALIRDLADDLYTAIEDFPQQRNLVIRHRSDASSTA